jgi:hypothetical protein
MKKAILLFSTIALLTAFSNKARAQFMGTFSIEQVIGLPDTLNANGTYSFAFQVRNVGNSLYSGSINFDFYVDSMTPGTSQSFGANQVGGFTPGDSAIVPVTYNFNINNSTFNIGDNVVVVWPRAINPNSAADSLTFHVFITNLNSIDESDKTADLKIFPNPANDFVSFTSEKNTIEEVKLYDMSGRLVLQSKEHLKIFTGHLTEGVYIAEAHFADGIISRRKIIAGKD